MSFVERHGLWSQAQHEAAADIVRQIEADRLSVVRFSFPDQHGVLRGKTLVAAEAVRVLRNGISITSTLLAKDTAHRTVFPVFTPGGGFGTARLQGGSDVLMVPDPTTFRVLPWAKDTGWVLCDLAFADGSTPAFATRSLYRRVLDGLEGRGYAFLAGLEVECHIFRIVDPRLEPRHATWPGEPPEVALISPGYQYLTEQRYDLIEPIVETIRPHLIALGMPLRSIEVELGPSQCEFTFGPTVGIEPADLMMLFRSAVKQICRREGLHATFMCRPKVPNTVSSGWHLHQSLRPNGTDGNAFCSTPGGDQVLSELGQGYLAGLLANARAAAVFSTPTVNGYKRYRAYSLAPDRATWGRDNRGVMVRVLGEPGDAATRLENRIGEPAANPYLYMASQILSGLDGIDRGLRPGPSADAPYEADAPSLPKSLREAVFAVEENAFFRDAMGAEFVDYYVHIKKAEIERFQSEVTDWEQREYFEVF